MITRTRFLSLLLAVAAVVSTPVLAQQNLPAGKWQAGRNYRVVSPPQATSVGADKVEVIEIFWYGCGACFVLDPYLETWKKSKPAHVEFIRVPVTWNAGAKLHARLY